MKSDISKLMTERNLDAVVVSGSTDKSSDLAYLTDGAALEGAMFLQRRDSEPVIVASVLEREVAAATGFRVVQWGEYDFIKYLKDNDKDRLRATVALWGDLLRNEGINGRVGFYGTGDLGWSHLLLGALADAEPGLDVIGEPHPNLFTAARETKDSTELEHMRRAGVSTTKVIDAVVSFLQSFAVEDETLVRDNGQKVTIGDVKAFIRLELAKLNLDEPHENIFSQGRDAGVPHNRGDYDMPLRLGESIIFDIFPRDRESGYYHDVTRSFFLGHAPDHVARAWHDVKKVFDAVIAEMKIGGKCASYQALTCDLFEQAGYPTLRQDPKIQQGYVHSLGHGVGREVHEAPNFSSAPTNESVLEPGNVITVEPGLYFPDEGWGVRIEDTIAFTDDGEMVNLTDYPYEMVIPVG